MIHLDSVEDLLSEVLRRLDSQDSAIHRLNNLVETLMPISAAKESYTELRGGIKSLSTSIDQVREDILVNIDGGRVPVAAAVASQHANLARLNARSPLLIERAEVELQLGALSAGWQADTAATRAWAASDDVVGKIQSAHTETVRRLNGVESMVACKLDRSEMGYLEGLANNFESFSQFQQEVYHI
jgi:hypothetical protein